MAFVLKQAAAVAVFWSREVVVEIDFCWCRLFCLFSLLLLPQPIQTHWLTLQAVQVRFPGCCQNAQSFDCGDGHCLSVSRFHDGHADCADGSDEFCLPGQIPCGQFCADPLHLGECLRNPNCIKKSGQENDGDNLLSPPIFCPLLKRRLCGVLNTISCRGYGECIFVKWLMDGKRDCLDGSDEDLEYADLFKITPLRVDSNEPQEQQKKQPSLPSPRLNEQMASTKKSPQLPTIFPTKSIELSTTIKAIHFWGWTEKMLIGSKSLSTTMKIVPWKPSWEIGKGEGREQGKDDGLPFGIDISSPKKFEGQGLRMVESTEPGPWENPALDDFGGEFARYLITITQSTFIDKKELTTESGKKLITGAAGSGKAVDKSIVFPNWPEIEEKGKIQKEEEGKMRIWRPTTVLKEAIGDGNLPVTTPKYPFDRGKIDEGEFPSIWMPIPFSRPSGKASNTQENVGIMTTTMKGEIKGKTTAPDVWLPEEGIGLRGKGMESGGVSGNEEIRNGFPEDVSKATTKKTEEREGEGRTAAEETEEGTIGIESTTEEEKEEEFTSTTLISSTLTRHSEEETSMHFATFETTSPFGQINQNTTSEMSASAWSLPAVSPSLLSSISTNLSATTLNCTERMSRMATQVYSLSSSATRCQCPKGQMLQIDGQCRPVKISTFRARLESLCDLRLRQSSQVEKQLTLMKLAASFPNQPICVRAILDEPGIVMNTICASNCTLNELNDRLKLPDAIVPEIKLKIAELSACSYGELNDCDEKAECLVRGLGYECRCLAGTNDTSGDGFNGRSCEGTIIMQSCIKLFGVCLLVWLLLLLLLCFMLPIMAYLCFKYCCESASTSEVVRMRWRWVKAKILGKEPTLLPIITTSSAPTALRRESGPSGLEFSHRADTLKAIKPNKSKKYSSFFPFPVPSIIDGHKPYIPPPFRQQQSQAESEDYLILEDEEGGGEFEAEEETKKDSGEKGEEEENSEARTTGKTTRQQTEQSSGTLPTQKSAEGKITSTTTVSQLPTEIKEESMPTEPATIEQLTEPSPYTEQQPRPPSVASRAGTPTIWDQFRILGDQYSRVADIDERRESKTSLEELMEKAKERKRAQQIAIVMERDGENEELAERMKDDLDAELKMRSQKVEEEEIDKREEDDEEEVKQKGRMKWRGGGQEPGRSIPASMLPPGAVNIGFSGFIPDDIDIPTQPPMALSIPPPQRQFVPKPFGARKNESRVSSGGTVMKMPSGERKMPKGEFVLIRGRTMERDEEKRLKMEGKRGEERELRDRRERMRRLKEQKSLDESMEGLDRIGDGKREISRHIDGFDPDLPTTSQADPYWQRNFRKQHKKHSADFLRQKFRKEGKVMQKIEEQIEEKVHKGCIVGGRKPWDVSPRMDGLDLFPPPRRELTQSDEAEMNRSMERLETKIHSGCITDRKPWDPSPFQERKGAITIRHGHSELELDDKKRIRRRIAWERPNSLERGDGRKRQQNWLDLD